MLGLSEATEILRVQISWQSLEAPQGRTQCLSLWDNDIARGVKLLDLGMMLWYNRLSHCL